LQQLQLLLRKGKQIIKNGFSGCKNSFLCQNFYAPVAMKSNDIEETKTTRLFCMKF
jgi:hypothetical protein